MSLNKPESDVLLRMNEHGPALENGYLNFGFPFEILLGFAEDFSKTIKHHAHVFSNTLNEETPLKSIYRSYDM